jgi:hypothetical protein
MRKVLPLTILLTLVVITIITATAPLERTLGESARLVYLHGAWVWAAMVTFLAAGFFGLIGIISRREALHEWSRALGRTALLLWITFLPQSLYLMQANWSGIFLDEPRFRIPMNLAVVGLLLQVGVSFFPAKYASTANIFFAGVLVWNMSGMQTVLHPEGPIQGSGSASIQFHFVALLVLMIALGIQIANIWRHWSSRTAFHSWHLLCIFLSSLTVLVGCSGLMFTSELPHVQQVALADLNGNSHLDAYIAVGTYPYPDYILYNDGTGRFYKHLQLEQWPSHSVALGDLTGNGIADVLLDITGGGLVLFANDGHSLRSHSPTGDRIGFLSEPGPIGVMTFRTVFGDLTGNGFADIFAAGCCGRQADMSVPPLKGNLLSYSQVWLDSGDGGILKRGQIIGQMGSNAAALADLNGSGYLDVFLANGRTMDLAGNYHPNTPNTVWFNDGQAQFKDSGQRLGQAESMAVALGDLNGDGFPDAVAGNRGPDEVWFNDGQGNFSVSEQRLGDGLTKFVFLADLNGSGYLDIFMSGETESRIWSNDGTGHFTSGKQKFQYKRFDSVTLGDLDGNGCIDILVVGVDYYQVWRNDGDGHFSSDPRTRYP